MEKAERNGSADRTAVAACPEVESGLATLYVLM